MISALSCILHRVVTPSNRRNAYAPEAPAIYCPRCDKPITRDHRCLSRRHFFGLLGAAAALSAQVVKPFPGALANRRLASLRPGDLLSVGYDGGSRPGWASVDLTDQAGHLTHLHLTGLADNTPLFIAPRDYILTGVRIVTGDGLVSKFATLSITRGPR